MDLSGSIVKKVKSRAIAANSCSIGFSEKCHVSLNCLGVTLEQDKVIAGKRDNAA